MDPNQNTLVKPNISDEAVRAATGKEWDDWFSILDAAGAETMNHREIVAYLNQNYQMSMWWEQMVTVSYEQARGLRQKHQKSDGYQVSVSKTLPVPIDILYKAWSDEQQRARWLPQGKLKVRRATPLKSMRITWEDGQTSVDANFTNKTETKSQITVQHSNLLTAEDAERMKTYWQDALERLEEFLLA